MLVNLRLQRTLSVRDRKRFPQSDFPRARYSNIVAKRTSGLPLLLLKHPVLHIEDGADVLLEIVVVSMSLVTEGTLHRVVTGMIRVKYRLSPSPENPTRNARSERVSDASS